VKEPNFRKSTAFPCSPIIPALPGRGAENGFSLFVSYSQASMGAVCLDVAVIEKDFE